jgi:hypothetical protein
MAAFGGMRRNATGHSYLRAWRGCKPRKVLGSAEPGRSATVGCWRVALRDRQPGLRLFGFTEMGGRLPVMLQRPITT